MKDIIIDVGVHTALNINLSDVDFSGIEKIVFTVKNYASVKAEEIIEREFKDQKIYEVTITPEESVKLKDGAVYDFDKILPSGMRLKMTDNGRVIIRRGVGDCFDD